VLLLPQILHIDLRSVVTIPCRLGPKCAYQPWDNQWFKYDGILVSLRAFVKTYHAWQNV
jgi:hypothetical protein